jgi:hypothetical protein
VVEVTQQTSGFPPPVSSEVRASVLANSNRHDAMAHDEAARIGESIAVTCVREFTAKADRSRL